MCSFTFYFTWSMWLGKLVFSSSLRIYQKRIFFIVQVVHEVLNIFFCFSSWKIHALVLFTESWKHLFFSPFVPFYFANHVYRKNITNDILWIEILSFEHSSPLKIQFYKNFAILFVIILIKLTPNQLRRKHI